MKKLSLYICSSFLLFNVSLNSPGQFVSMNSSIAQEETVTYGYYPEDCGDDEDQWLDTYEEDEYQQEQDELDEELESLNEDTLEEEDSPPNCKAVDASHNICMSQASREYKENLLACSIPAGVSQWAGEANYDLCVERQRAEKEADQHDCDMQKNLQLTDGCI